MSFSDHKITAFQHKITDLPDQPSLPANELKARFDSSPEELRQAVNGICDEASRLEARVEGIVVDTFGDTIDREMLSEELAAELDAKATQAALTSETTALKNRVSSLEQAMPKRAQVIYGTYTGDGTADRTIYLGFRPKAVLLFPEDGTTCFYYCPPNYFTCQGGLILDGYPLRLKNDRCNIICAEITDTGFAVKIFSDQSKAANIATNRNGTVYHYLALA